MNNGMKYTFVCDPDNCDTLIEVTCPSGFDFPNGEVKMICPCGRQMSYISATIQPITNERNKMEESRFAIAPDTYNASALVTYKKIEDNEVSFPTIKVSELEYQLHDKRRMTEKINSLQSKINRIIDNMTHDYWYNPNTETSTILEDLCEILDYTPKKEIQFTAVMHFSGRIDVDMADVEDFDLTDFLSEAYVDINHGDVVIDDYELYSADEC